MALLNQRSDMLAALLRAGAGFCFIGHGAFGILQKEQWLAYFALFGIDAPIAQKLMPLIGTVDIAIGLLILLRPARAILLYATVWCVFTALLRPLAGEGVWETLERAGNYGAPLALLYLAGVNRNWLDSITSWDRSSADVAFRIVQGTTVLLLIGHGVLALQNKPLLLAHTATLGLPPSATPIFGAAELALALACIVLPYSAVFVSAALWKIASESLFLLAGAPVWEFVERAGSYAAPLAAALLASGAFAALPAKRALRGASAALISTMLLLPATLPAQQSQFPGLTPELTAQLQKGGLVLACRHAVTDRSRMDKQNVDFDDPTTQRVLSPEGEKQAEAMGAAFRKLGLRFSEVFSSRYQRTMRSAELMFGRVEVSEALFNSRGHAEVLQHWLHDAPADGQIRALSAHQGTLYQTFKNVQEGSVAEGDCLVIKPGAAPEILAQVKSSEWNQ